MYLCSYMSDKDKDIKKEDFEKDVKSDKGLINPLKAILSSSDPEKMTKGEYLYNKLRAYMAKNYPNAINQIHTTTTKDGLFDWHFVLTGNEEADNAIKQEGERLLREWESFNKK